jgi:hypothetical protein
MLKRLSMLVAAGALVAVLAPAAQALTPAPLSQSTDIIQVRQGCGPGFHRGPRGHCVRNHERVRVCRWVAGARVCRWR